MKHPLMKKVIFLQVLMMNAISKSIDGLEVDLTYMPSENVSDDLFVSVRDVLIFLELARFKHHSDQSRYQSKPSYSKEEYISVCFCYCLFNAP